MWVAAVALAISGCTGDDDGVNHRAQIDELPATAPPGELLCDMLPVDTVTTVTGTGDVEAEGGADRDSSGKFAGTPRCRIMIEGEHGDILHGNVPWAEGNSLNSFEAGLDDDRFNQLPDEVGLGFSWTEENSSGESSSTRGHARLLHGSRVVEMDLAQMVEGRDPEADAIAVAQQVIETLELGDEWILPGDPPSR
ncbi:hypothetical protein [Phytoactinopolyspora halophila]|nr:hypothetical protein [Phytoactinopolyspora halophila]